MRMGDAAEQRDEADEGRLEAKRGMVGAGRHEVAATKNHGGALRPSQLIASVRRLPAEKTQARPMGTTDDRTRSGTHSSENPNTGQQETPRVTTLVSQLRAVLADDPSAVWACWVTERSESVVSVRLRHAAPVVGDSTQCRRGALEFASIGPDEAIPGQFRQWLATQPVQPR